MLHMLACLFFFESKTLDEICISLSPIRMLDVIILYEMSIYRDKWEKYWFWKWHIYSYDTCKECIIFPCKEDGVTNYICMTIKLKH